ncbi:hypothetical protein H5410_022762 [Solanum commersonii]|uniref:Amine oxidase domain-containing protein n=1 Tax=Solanum commersonii TaxID=4109 RepID=A0A9J5ZEZ0_SOLCO|nr:hypothetical protein H5410_022762 [Solanum commersonii]
MKVAVVGAGISGLVYAYELAKFGVKATYPNMVEFFEFLGVDMDISDMSFSVSLAQGRGCEWGTRNGFSSLFAQKKNVLNPYFWQMITEISRCRQDVISYLEALENNPDIDRNETLGQFIESHVYSELFQKAYLLFGLPQLLTVRWRSHINKVKEELEKKGCQIRTSCDVNSVTTNEEGCTIACNDGAKEVFDGCIMGADAPNTLKMLGKEATGDETRILGAFQNLGESKLPYFVTVDPPHTPEHTLVKWRTSHSVPSVAASKASRELHQIQGKRGIWFCGAYQGYGFHANGLKAGVVAADSMLRRSCSIRNNPKHMVPTWPETGARLVVARFFKSFIQTVCIILLEEGGTIFTFQGTERKCSLKVSLRVHSTQFYWKVATQADIGLADAFIQGDFSFVDKNEGLLNLIMAKISKEHHILEIGFGWGSFSVEVVKQTGCKYTGITLSEQQLEYAQLRVEQAGLQFISIPDERYDSHRNSTDFMREYIFPGGGLNALSQVTVEHLENIGIHYYQTLKCWRRNFFKNQSQIRALGFDDKFIRTWEYYFDYCAAGFKTCTIGDYQIVFSRPGNVAAFGDPYNDTMPSAY